LPASDTQIRRLLARKIKTLRRVRDWTQEELAERAGMQRSYLADLERGSRNPSLRTILKMANALGVTVSALLE
jgi:transcriptional regulator with XRE-family HTH domain